MLPKVDLSHYYASFHGRYLELALRGSNYYHDALLVIKNVKGK